MEKIQMPLDAYGKPMEFVPFMKWLAGYDFDAERIEGEKKAGASS
jgi:hypothetical protein